MSVSVAQPLMLRHALKLLQHLRPQPVKSKEASSVSAKQMLLQDRKSSLQTRTLWLPRPQGRWLGSDRLEGGFRIGRGLRQGVAPAEAQHEPKRKKYESGHAALLSPKRRGAFP